MHSKAVLTWPTVLKIGRNYYTACGILGNHRHRLGEKILLVPSSMDVRNIYRAFIRLRTSMLSFTKRASFQDVLAFPVKAAGT